MIISKSKKGVLEVQFNWIFVLVAGGIFLILFLTIINSQSKHSDETVNAELLSKIDSLITGSESSFQSIKTISLPAVDLEVVCDESNYSALKVGKSFEKMTPVQAIYSRPSLETKRLTIFTDAYKTGFDVASVLYLKGANTEYVILNETPYSSPEAKFIKRIIESFPENMTKVIDSSRLTDYERTAKETVFVKLSAAGTGCPAMSSDAICVQIDLSASSDETGYVRFCTAGKCTPKQGFAGIPMLKGAIMSADNMSYACNSKKLLKRQVILAKLAQDRSQSYIDSGLLAKDCKDTYAKMRIALDYLRVSDDFYSTDMDRIMSGSNSVALYNNDLIRGTRCPLLY